MHLPYTSFNATEAAGSGLSNGCLSVLFLFLLFVSKEFDDSKTKGFWSV
jgi:hypothetical protein